MKIAAGVDVGPYHVVEQVGRGGMATVFKAYQAALERYVAIKVLPEFLAEDPDFRERFRREAVAIA
jgi:eukaryotic-like serine/threonine-protein kinase